MNTQPTTCCPGPTAATLLVLVFLTGCNRPTGEDYQEKIISRLKTIDRNDVQVKQGHNFYWVILRYNDPTTAAEFHVLAKVLRRKGNWPSSFASIKLLARQVFSSFKTINCPVNV
jgi:hypothetical protein